MKMTKNLTHIASSVEFEPAMTEEQLEAVFAQNGVTGFPAELDIAERTEEHVQMVSLEKFIAFAKASGLSAVTYDVTYFPHADDAEVEYQDKPGHLWHMRYPLTDGSGYLVVATTRPETMMGDTGVAVNPEDGRYRDIVGKKCILPLVNKEIPIVADAYVDMEFGTGCVKMTPAHDPNDFEVGLRHNMESIRVLDDNGKVVEGYGRYAGMDRYEARKAIVADLEEQGYLVKVEEHTHNVGTCYRCHNDVEPQTIVACLVQAADAISAARPGARRENLENYIKRLEKLEEVTSSFPGVEKSFAIQAGREVRIMVAPDKVSEDQMVLLARDIAKKIEDELEYPGQIKVNLLRETKAIEYAK